MNAVPLAMVEVSDRSGRLLVRHAVRHWPLTIGRALSADLVLDDPHVAGEHLRLDRDAEGVLRAQVLDTVNGVALGRQRHDAGGAFVWNDIDTLDIGRLHLRVRLADSPLAPEQALPRFPWGMAGLTVLAVLAAFAADFVTNWIQVDDPQKRAQRLPGQLLAMAGALGGWAGAWALLSKLFAGHPNFWRHVRIASMAFAGAVVLAALSNLLAFMFSWESLALHDELVWAAVAALAVYLHLLLVVLRRRVLLAGLVAGVSLLGAGTVLGSTWMQHKRLARDLYMASLFPPGWRVAPAVPVRQFVDEASALKARVDERRRTQEAAGAEDDDD